MYIPECLLWSIRGGDGCTAVKIYCEEELRKSIAARFTEVFNEKYEKLMDLIEEEEEASYEKEMEKNPFYGANVTDYGVFLPFDSFAMYCGTDGDFISDYDAGIALELTLETINQEYPSIRYEGYVAYYWTDVHGGEAVQYEISSEKKKDKNDVIYDFVGEALGKAIDDEETWEQVSEELAWSDDKEYKKVIKLFHAYSKWIPSDAIDKVIEISKESDEDLAESLQEFADALKSGEDVDIESAEGYAD